MLKDSDKACKWLSSLMSAYSHNIGQSSKWVGLIGKESEVTDLQLSLRSLESKLYFVQDSVAKGDRTVTDICEVLQEGVADFVEYGFNLLGLYPSRPAWESPVVELEASDESMESEVVSPDGSLLTVTVGDNYLCTWNTDTWELNEKLSGNKNHVAAVAYSPDSKFLALAYWDSASTKSDIDQGVIEVLDARTGKCVSKIIGIYSMASILCWSVDGKCILAESSSQDIDIWDAASGALVDTLSEHYEALAFIKCSQDGKLIISGDLGGRICVWDAKTHERLKVMDLGSDDVFTASLSPDGKFLAVAGYRGVIRILETETWQEVQSMSRHVLAVSDISYSPNGKFLVSGGADGTIRIWDVQTGECLKTYASDSGDITVAQWLPDGKHIACGGQLTNKVYIIETDQSWL